jgi:hypothetical protein
VLWRAGEMDEKERKHNEEEKQQKKKRKRGEIDNPEVATAQQQMQLGEDTEMLGDDDLARSDTSNTGVHLVGSNLPPALLTS